MPADRTSPPYPPITSGNIAQDARERRLAEFLRVMRATGWDQSEANVSRALHLAQRAYERDC